MLTYVLVAVLVAPAAADPNTAAAPGETIQLWPAERLATGPGEQPERAVTKTGPRGPITRVHDVSNPTLTVSVPQRPAAEPAPAVIVCPGGGYGILAWDLEGTEVVEWLNSIGVVGALLKYRVPRRRDDAFADAQRAMSLLRARAGQWKADPKKAGILGFSAGGHLAARLCTNHDKRTYPRVDAADDVPLRPDFAILIYPAYMAAKGAAALDANTLPVSKATPPAFLAIASLDRFTPGALQYFLALRKHRVRSELHVFHHGGHGCGLRPNGQAVTTWPAHCERWLRAIEVLPADRPPADRIR